jgi:hypothetical protein
VALLAALLVAGCGGSDGGKPASAPLDLAGIPQQGTALGHARAVGTLAEFTDLRCPRCRDYELHVFPALVQRYVRAGRLRIVRRVIAVSGPESADPAAWAAAAARQDRLYRYVDAFFRETGRPDAAQVASKAGVDVRRARRYATSGALERALARTSAQARGAAIVPPAFYFSMRGGPQQPFPVRSMTPAAFTTALDRLLAR